MSSRCKILKTTIRHLLHTRTLVKMNELRNQVLKTFGNGIGGESFNTNLENVLNIMGRLTAEDVKLDRNLLLPQTGDDAPVTYVEILEHPRFTINMFVLRPGTQLPLHDHPNMYGICKVVSGTVRMRNFSLDGIVNEEKKIEARLDSERIVSESDGAILLTPTSGNIHEIKALGVGGAAFVDVLAPPYLSNIDGLGPRPCHYFIETQDSSKVGDSVTLTRVERVSYYFTDFAPYLGD